MQDDISIRIFEFMQILKKKILSDLSLTGYHFHTGTQNYISGYRKKMHLVYLPE